MNGNIEPLSIVIVDDEERSRAMLIHLIEDYVEEVQVVAVANDVLSGVKMIQKHEPDVVLLDIEMPNYSGFNLVEYFDDINFEIVFTTAYEKYALKAYKVHATGYLLKPIDIEDLIQVFEKIRKKRATDLSQFQSRYISDKSNTRRFIFPTFKGLVYVNFDEICHIESNGRTTIVAINDEVRIDCTLTLKECAERLSHATFIRIHRSYIINLMYIQNYIRGRDGHVILDNNFRIDVGLQFKENLNQAVALFLK